VDGDAERERAELIERLERLERSVARGEEGLEAYETYFAKLRTELEEVRALVAAGEPVTPVVASPPVELTPTPVTVDLAASGPPPQPQPTNREVAAPQTAPPKPPPRPTAHPKPPRRTLGELARDWDLMGARGFAIAGGAVMALGIGFFFVLAANRGWIGEGMRIALGAGASALVFTAGLSLRARYGQYWSALAAVAAGIAGAYATLAAATVRYDVVPDALALPLAAVIAGIGTAVAIRWRSQVIAGIALLGAALAPALQALDVELTWESVAFATIVLIGAACAAVPRAWHPLLVVISVLVAGQVEWLAVEAVSPVDPGTVAVATAFVLTLLGIAVGRQLVSWADEVDPLGLTYALVSLSATMLLTVQLFEERGDRGVVLLAAAAVWALVFAALSARRLPDLGLVVGVSALALAAVGTADLLSDAALTLAWAAQALLFAIVARRLGDARLQAMGFVYLTLAAVSALVSSAKPEYLFDKDADQLAGVLPLGAVAVAAIGGALFVPAAYRERTESGLLAFVAEVRKAFATHRGGIRETLALAGGVLGTLAASFLLVSISFEGGHIGASYVAAAVGGAYLAAAARIRSNALAVASYAWLAVVLVESFAFDVDSFSDDATDASQGGWSVLAASGGLLFGAYVHRILDPERRGRDWLLGVAATVAGVSATLGMGFVWPDDRLPAGIGLLLVALVYFSLAGGVFSRVGSRNASTILWSLGLALLVGAEALIVSDSVARSVVIVATALVVGALARPLRETRLWLAGASLGLATTAVVLLAQVQPWLDDGEIELRMAIVSGACTLALLSLAAFVWSLADGPWRDLATVVWSGGIVALLSTERVLLDDWRATAAAVAVTGAVLALVAHPLREQRLWTAGCIVAAVTTVIVIGLLTPPSHVLVASDAPADGLWVLLACLAAVLVVGITAREPELRVGIEVVAGGLALYALSLGILEVAERVSAASVETDFERGHTAVSGLWALVGLGLLVAGLLRGSPAIRYGGLALFGLSLAKIFLYDLSSLSSVARAFSFIFVGGLLLAGGFFLQRLSDRLGPPKAS
jgi:uncharacterized membrane protein